MRSADAKPSTCVCLTCGLPLDGYDHRQCDDPVELLACPKHFAEQCQSTEEIRRSIEQQRDEFRLEEKLAKLQSPPDGPERNALNDEVAN
jgi:hypothetical protein